MKLTAVICTYDRYDLIPGCLSSLLRQKLVTTKDFKILIVDNTPASKREDISELLPSHQFPIEVIISSPPGLSRARNTALDHIKEGIVAFIDDDALASEMWANSLITTFEADENIGCVGGKVAPSWPQNTCQPDWMPDEFLWFLSMIDWGGNESRLVKDNEWLVGANIAVFPNRMKQKTRFDINLGRNATNNSLLSNEENSFMIELKRQDLLIFYDPNASVEHIIPLNRINKKWFIQRITWQAISDWTLDNHCNPKSFEYALKDIYEMPFESKNIRSLSLPSNDKEVVGKQRDILYNVIFSALNGFEEL